MIVLGLDTATASSAVALRLADGTTSEARDDPRPGEHPGHATRLLGMTRELLDRGGIGWADIERIAVGVGPGTFTGLRVGIATARGLAQSLAVELVGVSSLQALAHVALADSPERAVMAVIDARRGEVFAAAYTGTDTYEGGPPRARGGPIAVVPTDLAELVAGTREGLGGGEEALPRLAVGDGAVRYRGELEALSVEVPADGSPLHRVSAGAICALGAATAAGGGHKQVLPDYCRRPDAELALEGAGAGGGSAP